MLAEKQRFYRLFQDVCELLPTGAINSALTADYNAKAVHLIHVRQGRTVNLPHLIALIQYGLPEFSITVDLLPEMGFQREGVK